jgi:hypothetical protein
VLAFVVLAWLLLCFASWHWLLAFVVLAGTGGDGAARACRGRVVRDLFLVYLQRRQHGGALCCPESRALLVELD